MLKYISRDRACDRDMQWHSVLTVAPESLSLSLSLSLCMLSFVTVVGIYYKCADVESLIDICVQVYS